VTRGIAVRASHLPFRIHILVRGRARTIISLDFNHSGLGRPIAIHISLRDPSNTATGIQVGIIVVATGALFGHVLCFIHELATICLECVISWNLLLPWISIICRPFHYLFSLLNDVGKACPLLFVPLIFFGIVLGRVVLSLLSIIVAGAWALTFLTLCIGNDLREEGGLGCLVETHVDLTMNSVEHIGRIGSSILYTDTFKLCFSFGLHHILDSDTSIEVFLSRCVWIICFHLVIDSLCGNSTRMEIAAS